MANFVYKKAKEALLNGQINVLSDQLKVLLLKKPNYTPNQDIDQHVSDIPANAIIKRSEAIAEVSSTSGVLDAANITILEYNGSAFDAIALYKYQPSDSNSKLIFYIDTSSGLPFAGSNSVNSVTIFWSDESTKILSL